MQAAIERDGQITEERCNECGRPIGTVAIVVDKGLWFHPIYFCSTACVESGLGIPGRSRRKPQPSSTTEEATE